MSEAAILADCVTISRYNWRGLGRSPTAATLSRLPWERVPAVLVESTLLPMCILAIQYRAAKDAPVLLAHNREERLDRPSLPPRIQSGKPRVVCGIDRKAGGTWLGVTQHGLAVAVANRPKAVVPAEPRSRGLLCRELLNCQFRGDPGNGRPGASQ